MKEYIKLSSDKKFGSVSVRFYISQDRPLAIGKKMQEIYEQAVMTGHNWEAFLNYYLETNYPEISAGMGSDPDNKNYVAYYKLTPDNEKKAEKLAQIIEGLVENESVIYETLKNHADEIDWD
jgi:hypothetical protein